MNPSYRSILSRADQHFAEVRRQQPENLACRVGCTMCCHGLFEISSADVAVVAEGMRRLPGDQLNSLIESARSMVAAIRHPDLRSVSQAEKEEFFERTDAVPCPALGPDGACRIYENRPLVCRTFGIPLKEGGRFLGEECELNFTSASEDQLHQAAWDLEWEDVIDPEDQYTVPEAIVLAARLITGR